VLAVPAHNQARKTDPTCPGKSVPARGAALKNSRISIFPEIYARPFPHL